MTVLRESSPSKNTFVNPKNLFFLLLICGMLINPQLRFWSPFNFRRFSADSDWIYGMDARQICFRPVRTLRQSNRPECLRDFIPYNYVNHATLSGVPFMREKRTTRGEVRARKKNSVRSSGASKISSWASNVLSSLASRARAQARRPSTKFDTSKS